jgi:hypothetical protein
VGWQQVVSGAFLVSALVSLSLYYGYRQLRALRRIGLADLPREEAGYYRAQARRRLVGSGLMFVMAWLLTGVMLYLEEPAQQLADQRDTQRGAQKEEDADPLTPDERTFLRIYGGAWIGILLILLALVMLAALDVWSTRRYGLRAQRKIQDDRRAMIERQVARLRQERNGHT